MKRSVIAVSLSLALFACEAELTLPDATDDNATAVAQEEAPEDADSNDGDGLADDAGRERIVLVESPLSVDDDEAYLEEMPSWAEDGFRYHHPHHHRYTYQSKSLEGILDHTQIEARFDSVYACVRTFMPYVPIQRIRIDFELRDDLHKNGHWDYVSEYDSSGAAYHAERVLATIARSYGHYTHVIRYDLADAQDPAGTLGLILARTVVWYASEFGATADGVAASCRGEYDPAYNNY